jgi:hypothetical protein
LPETGGFIRSAPSFSQELESVPPGRRRLGWLVVAAAILLGTTVLLLLFLFSLYSSNPAAMHATVIEALSRETESRLAPDAMGRAEEIDDAFRALSTANDAGSLGWRQLFMVMRAYAETSVDGTIDSEEVDTLIESIREAVKGATSPRRF